MQRSATVTSLYVPDVTGAIRFYTDHLGFRCTASWREGDHPPVWAEMQRDLPHGPARLWFFSGALEGRPGPSMSGVLYLFVADVTEEAQRLKGQVTVRWGPEDQPYGLREFGIEDPFGYLICLAQDI
ncbi:MAG: VOC family protein [Alphaproteobacteria bacterium]